MLTTEPPGRGWGTKTIHQGDHPRGISNVPHNSQLWFIEQWTTIVRRLSLKCNREQVNGPCSVEKQGMAFQHTILTLKDPKKGGFWKYCGQMLVTSTFSFSHNVFYPSQKEFVFKLQWFLNLDQSKTLLFGKELIHLEKVISPGQPVQADSKFFAFSKFSAHIQEPFR